MTPTAALPEALDVHLILNGFSRITAKFFEIAQQECEDVYPLAEYLAMALRLQTQAPISMAQEAELLRRYIALQRSCKYQRLSVVTQVDPEAAQYTLTAHRSVTAVVHLLRCAHPGTAHDTVLAAHFAHDHITLRLQPPPADGDAFATQLQAALEPMNTLAQAPDALHASALPDGVRLAPPTSSPL
ncbi:MAG: hypothetical protein ACR2I0_14460 [Rhodoferax sp.]